MYIILLIFSILQIRQIVTNLMMAISQLHSMHYKTGPWAGGLGEFGRNALLR